MSPPGPSRARRAALVTLAAASAAALGAPGVSAQQRPAGRGPAAASSSAPAAPGATAAPAAPVGSASAQGEGGEALARAKELFRQGNELLKAGDNERALDRFLQSRALVPSVPNTMNAAICLDRLGRWDEALDLYEALLTELGPKLDDDDRRTVGAAMRALRARVGSIDVSANVDGALVIDGRRRGQLPLTSPVRVLPGRHLVRVLKEGYAPGEAPIEVQAGESRPVDLRLEALAASGRLEARAEGAEPGAELVVDGAPLGPLPFAGRLSPGRHLIWVAGPRAGTAPSAVTVLAGQTVSVSLAPRPLGPPLRLSPEPPQASLSLDGVELGPGAWEGRLPLGPHRVGAVDEGYFPLETPVDGASRGEVRIKLVPDESHPRWKTAEAARLKVELLGGYLAGGSMGGDAERACPGSCSAHGGPRGFLAGARGAYVLPVGLRFEVGAGYLRKRASVSRAEPGPSGSTLSLDDSLTVDGPYASAGLAYGLPLGPLRLLGRLSLGAFFARSVDAVSGRAERDGEALALSISGSGRGARGVDFFALPEAGLELALGRVSIAATVGAGIFLLDGPALPLGEASVTGATCLPQAGKAIPLACVQASSALAGERAHRSHTVVLPQLAAGYTF